MRHDHRNYKVVIENTAGRADRDFGLAGKEKHNHTTLLQNNNRLTFDELAICLFINNNILLLI